MAVTAKFVADFADFNKGVKGAEKDLASLESAAGQTGKALGGMEQQTSGLGTGLRQLGLTFTIGAAVKFASDIIAAGAAVNDLSERTGISVEALQQWSNVAEQSGSSIDAIASAAFKLSKTLAGDTASVATAVKTLGLDLRTLRDMTPEERFKAVTAALIAMNDPLKQAEVGAALLGKGFDELRPTLSNLSKDTSTLITYTKEQTAAMAALSNAATTTKNSIGPLAVNFLDWTLGVSRFTEALQQFKDMMNAVAPPVAQATARTQEWNKAVDDRAAKPLVLTLKEEQQFIEDSNEAVRLSVAAFKQAADMRNYYNMIGEREIELIEQQMAAQARADEARARTEAQLRDYYNWVGERQMEDAAKAEEATARKIAAEEAYGQTLMDTAIKEEQARFAAQGVGEAAKEAAPAVDLVTGSVISAGSAAQQTAGSFFQMSEGLYAAIRAAQQMDALAGADKGIYTSTIGGIGGSSASTRWGAANVSININGSVLGNKDEIARVVGDAVTSDTAVAARASRSDMALTGNQKAYKYALSNVARSGATRSGYVSGLVYVTVGGTLQHVQIDSLEIVDELNETANTCRFRIIGPTTISNGMTVVIRLGSKNNSTYLFAGHVLTTAQSYWAKPVNVRTDVSACDYTWQLSFYKVTKRYTNQSATAIVQDLIANYGALNGFGTAYVAAGLPTIPEITFTNEDFGEALSRTANRIGAYWYVDYYKQVHFFFTDPGPGPAALVPTHRSLADVRKDTERSQTLTRVYVEGRGSRLLSAVAVGDTMLPLEAVDMFTALPDVYLKASFQGAEGGAQHLSFTGVVPGGAGTVVGPGIGPSGAIVATPVSAASNIDAGTHGYAYTFTTAAGESLPSPVTSLAVGPVANPPAAAPSVSMTPTGSPAGPGGTRLTVGDVCYLSYSYSTGPSYADAHTVGSNAGGPMTVVSNNDSLNPTHTAPITMSFPYSTDPRITWIHLFLYSTIAGGQWGWWGIEANVPTGGTLVRTRGGGAGYGNYAQPVHSTNTTGAAQVNLSSIGIGPAAVTARKLYRTAAGSAQLKLLTTLANNTATTYTDTAADATLGANVPTLDTSTLQQPDGQVVPGATTLPVAGTGAFQAGGGWAVIGNGEQRIRYTGLSASALTGIPASGLGAIMATIAYNSTVTAAPMLTGIPASGSRSIVYAMSEGDEIYLVVQVDDEVRRAQLEASVGGTGVREEWVQDRRLSIAEARARGQATLSERMLDQIRVSYTCRDLATRSGKDITVNLPAPTNLTGTFKIQHVVINNFRPRPEQPPTFTVQASSARFSFEDLLRLVTRDVAR